MIKRKTKRLAKYDAAFEKMKPLVRERSFGLCESFPFASRWSEEAIDIYNSSPVAVTCEFRNPVHIHHRKYRSRGGTNALSNLIHLCEPCHTWTHSHSELSNKLGLSLKSWEKEELC